MRKALAHKFGQILGDALEQAVEPLLGKFAKENNLYLDKCGAREARSGKKVCWEDSDGNKHDLDFVIEKDGTDSKLGTPIAFIESAWRRYTKHSRNKAQEIQGAIVPLALTYSQHAPFIGVILAGVFTNGALQQLRSLGFEVLYFKYDSIIKAFAVSGIDVFYDEKTTEESLTEKIAQLESLNDNEKTNIYEKLLTLNKEEVKNFMNELQRTINRKINLIRVFPLHGKAYEYANLEEAIAFLETYDESSCNDSVIRYEVSIRYNNDDEIRGNFADKKDAQNFLANYT